MLKRAVMLCLLVLTINPCFAGYSHCPFSEEEARREGWIFHDGRPIGEHELLSATISKTDRNDVFRIDCYYRRGYDRVKKIFDSKIAIIPKSHNWTAAEGSLLRCTESAGACTWQVIA